MAATNSSFRKISVDLVRRLRVGGAGAVALIFASSISSVAQAADTCPCFDAAKVYTACQISPVPNTTLRATVPVLDERTETYGISGGLDCARMLNGKRDNGARYVIHDVPPGRSGQPPSWLLQATLTANGRDFKMGACPIKKGEVVLACLRLMADTVTKLKKLQK